MLISAASSFKFNGFSDTTTLNTNAIRTVQSLTGFTVRIRFTFRFRFKIAVTATLNMSCASTSPRRLFQLKVDPLTGNSEWVVINEKDENDQVESCTTNFQKSVLANTSYLDMLNDSARNRAFRLAIDKTITRPCHVLDIGAGTGLLSMMAARAMSSRDSTVSKGTVTACEAYLPMVKLMKKVLRLNGMEAKIRVINKRSDELEVGIDIPSRADVLVSEILDSELLGEGLIPTLQHAHDNLLVEHPLTVPHRAVIYGQLAESAFLSTLNDLQGNEAMAPDGIRLVPPRLDKVLSVKQQQHPMHCDGIAEEIKLLSEPFKIFEFDFWKRPDSRGETEIRIKATDSGRVHAVISWWTLQLDREGTVFYSTAPIWTRSPTSPSSRDWCDHWKQCVWFVPGKGLSICNNEEINLHAVHTETTILYDLNIQVSQNDLVHHNLLAGNLELILSPERIAIYGNIEWRHAMLLAMKKALQEKDHYLCLVLDDSVFLPLLIRHLSQTTHVISLFPGLRDKGIRYLEAVAHENGFAVHHVKFISKKAKCLSIHDTHQKVDLLVAEPFYCTNHGMLPWENLRFWKERSFLDPLLTADATIIPCKGILKACAMSLPDLWNSRCCLSTVEGFDHSVVNPTLGGCGRSPAEEYSPCLPYFIWQCGEFKELSGTLTLMEFNCSTVISICHGEVKFEFTKPGTCHGFVMWIDWVMDSDNSIVVSTGPYNRFWKQGVKLLSTPVEVDWSNHVGGYCSAILKASFDPVRGELLAGHDFSRRHVS